MGKNKSAQLDLFGLFEEDTHSPSPSSSPNCSAGKSPGLQFNLYGMPENVPNRVDLSAPHHNQEVSALRFFSHRIFPSDWKTSFPDNFTRSNLYIETIDKLPDDKAEVQELIQRTRDHSSPELARLWMRLTWPQQETYSRYSGEGGLPISHDLVKAHLTFLKKNHPPAQQRELVLSGLRSFLSGSFPNSALPEINEMKALLKGFSSGELSATRIDFFLDLLGELDRKIHFDSNREMSKTLSSVEGNGAYYSPEQFQELLRLIPLTSLENQEINILEPNVGKGSLIRPLVHQPGLLIIANELNPISAEITELTTMVNPSAIAAACEQGTPVPITSNCIVTRMHAFDLCEALPDEGFDLLIANPPYISAQVTKEMKKKLKSYGLKDKKEKYSITEFTRKALPMKLREGGISLIITSARANNFKRTIHANGFISHPLMILALSGQPFSMNQAKLMPISMTAYPFSEGQIKEKEQIKAECFISINVLVSAQTLNRKNSVFSDCEIIHLKYNDLPVFTQHCLNPDEWAALDERTIGLSMQMLQSANLLRLFTMLKQSVQSILETEIQSAKRGYLTKKGEGYQKRLIELKKKRFQHISSFKDITSWIETMEQNWELPIQPSIEAILKKNPLRQYRANRENKALSPKIMQVLDRTFRSILAVKNRFFSRIYLLSEIHLIKANEIISKVHGAYTGECFTSKHSILGRIPYPFSLYLLKEMEIAKIIQSFPEIEQKEILSVLWKKAFTLNQNVNLFNEISVQTEYLLRESLGEGWYLNLSMGVLPEIQNIKPLTHKSNEICQALGKTLLFIAQQNASQLGAMNTKMKELGLLEKQRKYNDYLKQFSKTAISPIKRQNLLRKTNEHLDELSCGIDTLNTSARPTRKIRKLITVS